MPIVNENTRTIHTDLPRERCNTATMGRKIRIRPREVQGALKKGWKLCRICHEM